MHRYIKVSENCVWNSRIVRNSILNQGASKNRNLFNLTHTIIHYAQQCTRRTWKNTINSWKKGDISVFVKESQTKMFYKLCNWNSRSFLQKLSCNLDLKRKCVFSRENLPKYRFKHAGRWERYILRAFTIRLYSF